MNRIVHYYNGKIKMPGDILFGITHCGVWISKNTDKFISKTTKNESDVTCKNCLKKLVIKPVVDEEKKRWAEQIMDIDRTHDRAGKCILCRELWHTKECVFYQAEKYLASIKEGE